MGFVANFMRFSAVQKFWKSVKSWQSYIEFKGKNFFETQCRIGLITETEDSTLRTRINLLQSIDYTHRW